MSFPYLGSISSGTMRPEDLIPKFLYILGQLDKEVHDRIVRDFPEVVDEGDFEGEAADYCLDELYDALNECAPDYVHFSSHEGDGADYGFWITWEVIEEDVLNGTLLKIPSGDEWPEPLPDKVDHVLEITDHGNATLFSHEGKEIWSCI